MDRSWLPRCVSVSRCKAHHEKIRETQRNQRSIVELQHPKNYFVLSLLPDELLWLLNSVSRVWVRLSQIWMEVKHDLNHRRHETMEVDHQNTFAARVSAR